MGKINKTELVYLYKLGKSDNEIAKHFSVSQSAVSQMRNKLGLPSTNEFPRNEKPEDKMNIKVDSNWKLLMNTADVSSGRKMHLYTDGDKFRICIIKDDEDLWLEFETELEKQAFWTKLKKLPGRLSINQIKKMYPNLTYI